MDVLLDGKAIFTEYDFHCQIAKLLGFPKYYGNNCDALWDVLTSDIERPVNLVWDNAEISRKNLGEKSFQKIVEVLQEVQTYDSEIFENEQFKLELR